MPVIEQIRGRLQAAFVPSELDVLDEGHLHAGHAGEGKGHFHVRIVSAAFAGQSPIRRHRMIYAALDGLMDNGIHALSIDAK
ncbi:cell division protein BolA [Rhodanobacter sp. FW510-R12]|uniref:BolA family protein n=1 Tax=unclassified Rhodanobacter TaxID=2621553 RepID=UPI0007A9CB36|nr:MULTISPECIES: BolA family protein [unclassified Rhodanobacter]KZC15941.1 cell division protein BolA [Rhodanobacter sp. FW104-R8]KZC26604.1 cell division protein BolA [Rhodanobacter sp. FW510-T8]KZC30515.1 cell division protein BolA [Rhodanobacter sp. FW510-R10]